MIKATVSRAALRSSMEKETQRVLNITQKQLNEIAKAGQQKAEELLENAEYDGSLEDVQVLLIPELSDWKWTLAMTGPAAASIEYGSTSNGKHDYWFFSSKGRNVTLKAGGAPAHYRRYIRSEVTKVDYGDGRIKLLDARSDPLSERSKRLIPEGFKTVKGEKSGNAVKVSRFVPVSGAYVNVRMKDGSVTKRQGGYGLEDVEKAGSYITKGNKPNNIMKKTFEYMAEEVDKIAK